MNNPDLFLVFAKPKRAFKDMKVVLLFYVWLLPMMISCTTAGQENRNEIIKFNSGGVTLEGILDLPKGDGRFPLVVFVHGSGRRTRADYNEFVAPFVADGFATFRYDKRGVGSSAGAYTDVDVGTENSPATILRLAKDAIAAVESLRHHRSIDSTQCILIGASQAGWIIPVAASLADIYLVATFSGPAVSVGEEIYYSSLAENGDYSLEDANKRVLSYQGPKGFDPIPYVSKLTPPSLWIFGSADASIPVERSIQLLEGVRNRFSLPIEIQVVPGVDHSMRSKAGEATDYVSRILNWIEKQRMKR
ncbi:MAG TPA: alpha/beta fold hydrolase [Chryseolinea sp.]